MQVNFKNIGSHYVVDLRSFYLRPSGTSVVVLIPNQIPITSPFSYSFEHRSIS